MKANQDKLDRVLREWRVEAPLPPRFQEQVWQRIERAEVRAVSLAEALRAWLAAAFARPAFAVAYVSVLAVAGLALGFFQASQKSAQLERQLEARYVQALDPYQRLH